jgi:lambda repressor-like predicted transcriptional regulator
MAPQRGKETEERILRLFDEGWPLRKISERAGVSDSTVRLVLIANQRVKFDFSVGKSETERILSMRRSGLPLWKIADAVGKSSATVRSVLLGSGHRDGLLQGRGRNRWPSDKAALARDMHGKGNSLRDIAKALGFSHEAVRNELARSGISTSRVQRHNKTQKPRKVGEA